MKARVCHFCGRHQNPFWQHFRIDHIGLLASVIMILIAFSQLNEARKERINANDAKDIALQSAQDANEAYEKANFVLSEIKNQKELVRLWVKILDAITIKDYEQGIEYIKQLLEKEENWLAYDIRGSFYSGLARKFSDEDKKKEMLSNALESFIKSSELNNYSSAIEVANIYAYFDQEEKCKEWIQKAREFDQLPTRDDIGHNDWLYKYSTKPWFKEIKWKEYD